MFFLIRLLGGIGLLGWLFTLIPSGELTEILADSIAKWKWWIAGIVTTFLGLFMAAIRWHGLLNAQHIVLNPMRVLRIFFIGQFFNAFMPGACGGDIARAYYVIREVPRNRTEAVSTVLVDRLIGLFTLVAFGCIMVMARVRIFFTHPGPRGAGILMIGFLAASVIGALIFFRQHLFENWEIFRRIEQRMRFGPLLRKAYNAFYVYRRHPRVLIRSILYSLGNMIFLTLACYSFGESLGLDRPMIDYFTLFPIITVLAAVPITPGALGIREGLFVELFYVVGVPAAKAVPLSLMVYAGGAFWSLAGGLVFIGYTSRKGLTLREELDQLKRQEDTVFE